MHPLLEFLDDSLRDARIRVRTPDLDRVVGRSDREAVDVALRARRRDFLDRVLAQQNLGLAEAFMDGDLEIEHGTLEQFLTILVRSRVDRRIALRPGLAGRAALVALRSALRGKAANVRRHYDTGLDLFESFLDESLGYSCGYAVSPEDSLEDLQRNKYDRICRKLRLAPGERLVDIGCGFGGLLIHAAHHHGVAGLGVTNSRLHASVARERVVKAGLDERVEIREGDFGSLRGRYDKLASVGMLEHVPRRQMGRYFRRVASLLSPDGLGLVHAIGFNGAKNGHDPFIQKYIFPGSRTPTLSEIARQLERNGLPILDVENVIRHYAHTARRWRDRFRANRATLDPTRYDERFARMWEYYLTCGIAAAEASEGSVWQVLFAADPATPIPLVRV